MIQKSNPTLQYPYGEIQSVQHSWMQKSEDNPLRYAETLLVKFKSGKWIQYTTPSGGELERIYNNFAVHVMSGDADCYHRDHVKTNPRLDMRWS